MAVFTLWGAVHCVEWIEKILGSANMKGGTSFVGTNFMCQHKGTERWQRTDLSLVWPNLHCCSSLARED